MNVILPISEELLATWPRATRRLPVSLRRELEAFFGAELSTVRIHEGPEAHRLGASAVTLGEAIYFAPGRYRPHTRRGLRLLGHELAHVLQQRAGRVAGHHARPAIVWSRQLETEADASGLALAQGHTLPMELATTRAPREARAPSASPVLQCDLDPAALKELVRLEKLDPESMASSLREQTRLEAQALLALNPAPSQAERKRIGAIMQAFRAPKKTFVPANLILRTPINLLVQADGNHVFKALENYLLQDTVKDWETSWQRIIANIWALANDIKGGGDYYLSFFSNLRALLAKIPSRYLEMLAPGLSKLFERLAGTSEKLAALGDYKGAAAEILDAIRSAAENWISLDAISIPTKNKKVDANISQNYTDKLKTKKLEEQDIDRTERWKDGTKFYVEVKADVDTAIDKHGKLSADIQLIQIMAVIATKEQKEEREGASAKTRRRYPAVAVVNPQNWLRFFTAGTANIYATHHFHLFIGGVRFSPHELKTIYEKIQAASQGREKAFYHANLNAFPPPATVKKKLGDLNSLLNLDDLDKVSNSNDRITGSIQVNGWTIPSLKASTLLPQHQLLLEDMQRLLCLFAQTLEDEDEDEQFRSDVAKNHRFFGTVGDGNCLFRAISILMRGTEHHHLFFRGLAVSHMMQYRGTFSDIDPEIDTAYLRDMMQSATNASQQERWGGYPEVYALSRVLRRKIVIVSSQFTTGWMAVFEQQDPRFMPTEESLCIYYSGGNHYEALRIKGG